MTDMDREFEALLEPGQPKQASDLKERLKYEKQHLTQLRREYKHMTSLVGQGRESQETTYRFGYLPYVAQLEKVQALEVELYGEARTTE